MTLHPIARDGPVTAVLGPTNTGKTHLAVERMMAHESGMIGLPLRLLAREIYDRAVAARGAPEVALITGEEKIVPASPRYYVCTVEAMPLDIDVAFLAIDEIQLADDPERGHVFTDRLLNARGLDETMFLGAETMRPLIKTLLPTASFITRPRFSDLSYAGQRKLSRLPRRSAIVSFSAESVYGIAELIRRQRGGAAVVLGALSPRTRNAQVALYQSGDVDFIVATDAIGMGLNMDVDHVAFAAMSKFDGVGVRPLKPSETAQIAGRAGRYMNDGTFGTTADAPAMTPDLVEQIENHRFESVRVCQWRNAALDFSSLRGLIASLEMHAPHPALTRSRPSTDLLALKGLAHFDDVRAMCTAPAATRRLWDVCQIPDFRNNTSDEHNKLLHTIFRFVMSDRGRIPDEWLGRQVDALDRIDGDVDTLSNRIAHVRTLTFVANRSGWIDDPSGWRIRTREIEDRLSDALHQRLTQRFIDRRTSVLMKRLRDREDLVAAVSHHGEVTVEGEYVGRLSGFQFMPDPRARGVHGKALRHASLKALRTEISARADDLVDAAQDDLHLSDGAKIWWRDAPVAHLKAGAHWLSPDVDLIGDELDGAERGARVIVWLRSWLAREVERKLAPLVRLRRAVESKDGQDLTGMARGIGYQLVENYAMMERHRIAEDINALTTEDRRTLKRFGVRIGRFSVFMPDLIRPNAAQLMALLWKVAHAGENPWSHRPPPPGRVAVDLDREIPRAFYAACGYRTCGPKAVRVDMVERLDGAIRAETAPRRAQTFGDAPTPMAMPLIGPLSPLAVLMDAKARAARERDGTKPTKKMRRGEFAVTPAMMSLLGCSQEETESVLFALGFRSRQQEGERLWHRRHKAQTRSKPRRRRPGPARKVSGKNKQAKGDNDVTRKSSKNAFKRKRKPASASPFAVLSALKDRRKA